jgi:hypothetical protein
MIGTMPSVGQSGDTEEGASVPTWEDSGTHRFAQSGDVLRWELHGPVLLADVLDLWRRNSLIRARYGYALLLIDGRDAGTMVAEARRQVVEFRRKEPDSLGQVAVFGVRPLSRVLLELVSRALYLVVKREAAVNLCASEADAWAVLEAARVKLQAQVKLRAQADPAGS